MNIEKSRERFFKKVEKTSFGCWHYTGYLTPKGYGRMNLVLSEEGTKRYMAHVASLLLHGITIPEKMVVDHKCKNRKCVNPDHLRVVSQETNTIENSDSPSALNKAKTHCVRGHEFSDQNTYIKKREGGKTSRHCRACRIK